MKVFKKIKHTIAPLIKLSIRETILIGIFAALTMVMSQISIKIPFSPVPVTLQICSICLAAVILGKKCGVLSQIVYILLGLCGFPVFSNFNSGLNALLGPTGGYIISFPFVALTISIIIETIEKQKSITRLSIIFAMLVGLFVCYLFGTAWLALSFRMSLTKTLIMGVGWYFPLDIIKVVLSSFFGYEVKTALLKANLI
jgi:biotin transport system substrate-specific component